MIAFQCEEYLDVIDELKEIVHDLYDEVGYLKDKYELDPNYELYENIFADKGGIIFTIREDDILVGFSLYFFGNHQYYKNCKVVTTDLLYVKPEHRGDLSKMFLESNEKALTELGVDVIQIQMMAEHDFSSLLEHIGYEKASVTCSKYVGKD